MSLKRKVPGLIFLIAVTVLLIISCSEKAHRTELDTGLIGTKALCVVTGDEFTIRENTPVVAYKGELYYMCCPGCDTEFMKDPEKYIMNVQQKGQSTNTEKAEGSKIEYWTCTMHPEVKADEEGNCPICGMTLTPVYERSETGDRLNLSERDMELAGIKTIPATPKHLYREIHLVGMVAYDPGLVTAQEEYVNAVQMAQALGGDDEIAQERAAQLIESSEDKLRLLGMDEAEIRSLNRTRKPEKSLILPEGRTWIYAEAFELDLGWIARGQDVIVVSGALPGRKFQGSVQSISPVLDRRTRAASVRIRLDHGEPGLTPGMYVEASIIAPVVEPGVAGKGMVLAIPSDAVLDTGHRQLVWVYLGAGQFEPRIVKLGTHAYAHGEDKRVRYYAILGGLAENEQVVTKGNFLVDSESSLTGIAAIGYGGALGVQDKEPAPAVHQH